MQLTREVSATVAEFLHGLIMAFPNRVTQADTLLTAEAGNCRMTIQLTPLPERRIAKLCLPNMLVEITIAGGSERECRAMLEQMDRAMHRGGG